MKNKYLLLFFCLCVWSVQALRAVEVISLDRGWKFHRGYESVGEELTVDLPHTWNKGDVMFAGSDYYRGMCIYSRPLSVPASWAGRRVFLRVEAAQTVADVFVNRRFVTQQIQFDYTFVIQRSVSLFCIESTFTIIRTV